MTSKLTCTKESFDDFSDSFYHQQFYKRSWHNANSRNGLTRTCYQDDTKMSWNNFSDKFWQIFLSSFSGREGCGHPFSSFHSELNRRNSGRSKSSFVLSFHQLNDSQLKRSSLLGLFDTDVTRILMISGSISSLRPTRPSLRGGGLGSGPHAKRRNQKGSESVVRTTHFFLICKTV